MAQCEGRCFNGQCSNGTCVCPVGFTGNADFLTGDLSLWGGNVLNCTSHLLTLRIMWSLTIVLCSLCILVTPVALCQQWRKFKLLHCQGAKGHWYQHRPFFYLVGNAVSVLACLQMSLLKLSTRDLRRVIGTDVCVSALSAFVCSFGIPCIAAYLLNLSTTFTKGISADSGPPSVWIQAKLQAARVVFVSGCSLVASTGLYCGFYLSLSPVEQRELVVLCNRLISFQTFLGMFLAGTATVAFTVEIVKHLDYTLRVRIELATLTRSTEMFASLVPLRRTRAKIIAMQVTVLFVVSANLVVQVMYCFYAFLEKFISYGAAIEFQGLMAVSLAMTCSYTQFSWPWKRKQRPSRIGSSSNEVLGRDSIAGAAAAADAAAAAAAAAAPSATFAAAASALQRAGCARPDRSTSCSEVQMLSLRGEDIESQTDPAVREDAMETANPAGHLSTRGGSRTHTAPQPAVAGRGELSRSQREHRPALETLAELTEEREEAAAQQAPPAAQQLADGAVQRSRPGAAEPLGPARRGNRAYFSQWDC